MACNFIISNPMPALWFAAGFAGGATVDFALRKNITADYVHEFAKDYGVDDTLNLIQIAVEPLVVGLISGAVMATAYVMGSSYFSHSHVE